MALEAITEGTIQEEPNGFSFGKLQSVEIDNLIYASWAILCIEYKKEYTPIEFIERSWLQHQPNYFMKGRHNNLCIVLIN